MTMKFEIYLLYMLSTNPIFSYQIDVKEKYILNYMKMIY